MKASEYRLGNLLQDSEGRLCKVTKLSTEEHNEIRALAIDGAITSLPNKPIPLTEEWLVNLGVRRTIKNKDSGYVQYGITHKGFDIMICIELDTEADVYVNQKLVIHCN
jgi:hypothetical protein